MAGFFSLVEMKSKESSVLRPKLGNFVEFMICSTTPASIPS